MSQNRRESEGSKVPNKATKKTKAKHHHVEMAIEAMGLNSRIVCHRTGCTTTSSSGSPPYVSYTKKSLNHHHLLKLAKA